MENVNTKKDVGNTREIQWVPVSEGYPDDARLVLVTLQYENGEYEIDLAEYWELNDYGMEKYPEEWFWKTTQKCGCMGGFALLHILKLAMINNMAANRIYFFGSLLSWVRTPPGLEKFRSSVGRAQI